MHSGRVGGYLLHASRGSAGGEIHVIAVGVVAVVVEVAMVVAVSVTVVATCFCGLNIPCSRRICMYVCSCVSVLYVCMCSGMYVTKGAHTA